MLSRMVLQYSLIHEFPNYIKLKACCSCRSSNTKRTCVLLSSHSFLSSAHGSRILQILYNNFLKALKLVSLPPSVPARYRHVTYPSHLHFCLNAVEYRSCFTWIFKLSIECSSHVLRMYVKSYIKFT